MKITLSEVNATCVKTTRSVSIKDLILRLKRAQQSIEQHILDEEIDLILYKKGSRPYSRLEHLEVVTNHIRKHLKDLNKKMKYGKA